MPRRCPFPIHSPAPLSAVLTLRLLRCLEAGRAAILNFPLAEYEAEVEELQRMALPDLVAALRSKARRHGAQTSSYRGVSLLRQTGKWHAQINVGGRQLHLGFFASEEAAARAYDRAAIHKAGPGGAAATAAVSSAHPLGGAAPLAPPPPPPTNFPLAEYEGEVATLQALTQAELLALLSERKGGGSAGNGSDRGGGSSGEGGSGLQAPHTATQGGSRRGSASKRRFPFDDRDGSDGSGGSAAGLAPGLPDIFPRGKGRRTRLRPCRAPAA